MSVYISDKCTKEELQTFKKEVLKWLNENFDISEMKVKAFTCYNGDVRLYTGQYNYFPNSKSSFRRTEADKDENGKIIGYTGTRGIHSTKTADYISINRDEFQEIRKALTSKDFFWENYMFRRLKRK